VFQEENAVLLDWMDLLSLALQFELSHRLKSGSISEFLDSFDLKYGTVPLSTASVCYCSVLYWSIGFSIPKIKNPSKPRVSG
jgi:hypothetical protein